MLTVQYARAFARKARKRIGLGTHITPRHYIEFINQFVRIYDEKRTELEEQQQHLNVGVRKIEVILYFVDAKKVI